MGKNFFLCYEAAGNSQSPCVLLIPGLGGQLIHWPQQFKQMLVDNGFYVVSYDNRDAGQSKSFKELGEPKIEELMQGKLTNVPYTLGDMASDAISLLNELKIDKAHIVGMSMGGEIAQLVAINYPERVYSLTCLMSTSGEKDLPPSSDDVNRLLMTPNSDFEHKLKLYKVYTHPNHFDNDEFIALAQALADRNQDPTGFVRQIIAKAVSDSRIEGLMNLIVPSLIIHGGYDPVFPIAHGRRLAEVIPKSQFVEIAELGHTLPTAFCNDISNHIASFCKKVMSEDKNNAHRPRI